MNHLIKNTYSGTTESISCGMVFFQSWAQANWFVIVAIMVGVVLLLVALGMAVYLAR